MSSKYFLLCLKDLAMYINEVKRDNETLKKISEFQSSIENLVSASGKCIHVKWCVTQNRNNLF